MARPRPVIRAARFGDIPALHGLLVEAHERSRLTAYPFDDGAAKRLLMNSIQRHGATTAGGTFVAVAEADGVVTGFILGLLQPLYLVLDALEATDAFFLTTPGSHASTGAGLLKAMHKWARSVPKLGLIRHAVTDVISDHHATGRLLARQGMAQRGAIYERD